MALVCKVELSQTGGLTLTVLNKDGKITQTSTFNGSTIVHICKGDKETSTITQKEDEVIMHIHKANDEESTITQTMNSITHCVTDSVDTSTITQKPDSLLWNAKVLLSMQRLLIAHRLKILNTKQQVSFPLIVQRQRH